MCICVYVYVYVFVYLYIYIYIYNIFTKYEKHDSLRDSHSKVLTCEENYYSF